MYKYPIKEQEGGWGEMGGAAAVGSGFSEGSRSTAYIEHRYILAWTHGPQIAHGRQKEEASWPLAEAQRVKEGKKTISLPGIREMPTLIKKCLG